MMKKCKLITSEVLKTFILENKITALLQPDLSPLYLLCSMLNEKTFTVALCFNKSINTIVCPNVYNNNTNYNCSQLYKFTIITHAIIVP